MCVVILCVLVCMCVLVCVCVEEDKGKKNSGRVSLKSFNKGSVTCY